MIAVIPSKYLINPSEHEEIFEDLKTDVFSTVQQVDSPEAIIIGGQPGAGKTDLINYTNDLFNNNIAAINGDDYREHHPFFLDIANENDKNIAEYTEADVRDWTSRLFKHSIEHSFNTILEITLRQHEPILSTIENLYRRGYQVHLKVVAVKNEFSTLGINARYEFQKLSQGYGRWTTQEAHDASFNNMPHTISMIEQTPFLSSISIFRRDRSVIYENQRDSNGKWVDLKLSAAQAIHNFRNLSLTQTEIQSLVESWKTLISLKHKRQAPLEEIQLAEKNVKELSQFIKPEESNPEESLFRLRF
jgi:energy-coupling factor transporter ATP-binding protein EcfA2